MSEDRASFEAHFLENLTIMSRTARTGTVDASVSPLKEGSVISPEILQEQVRKNSEEVIDFVWTDSNRPIQTPDDVRALLFHIAMLTHTGVVSPLAPDESLFRKHPVPYGKKIEPRDVPHAMQEFYAAFLQKMRDVEDGRTQPIDVAAWVDFELDESLHPFADGCGRISRSLAAYVLRRFQTPLPAIRDREEYYRNMRQGWDAFCPYYHSLYDQRRKGA